MVRLRPQADADLEEAAHWYEEQVDDLGSEFLDESLRTISRISKHPASYPLMFQNVRRAMTRRFPFCVYFIEENDEIVVIAVMHGTRHPSRWQGRT
ncbi:MAG: type II toxin-antitoxin system RelE/ParE family toxin [Gammaproteobacteria bacterium]|nr:type II toxin-antitoxin system RelE/ParE family toxin [Gammaproteobacteria bacterium]